MHIRGTKNFALSSSEALRRAALCRVAAEREVGPPPTYQLDGASAVYTLRSEFYAKRAPNPRFKRDQHFKAELVPFAAHEVRDTGLCNAEALGCIRLSELVFF